MNSPKTKTILEMVGIACLVMGALALWPFRFSYTAVCAKCGAEERVQEWKVPGTDWTFFRRSTEVATPLSKMLATSGLLPAHEHNWLFAAGGGNGTSCAIGEGRYLWTVIRQPKSAELLSAIQAYEGSDYARQFLTLALDPKRSPDDPAMMVLLCPTNVFSSKEQFHAWLSEYDLRLDDILFGSKANLLGKL